MYEGREAQSSHSCKASIKEIPDAITEHLQLKPLIITEHIKFHKRNQATVAQKQRLGT